MTSQAAVLVVDDDPLVLGLLQETLAPHFVVTTASSGNEALGLLKAREFEVLLADQRMPGMTGVALAARARELRPHVVTVLLSAYADPKDFIAAINHGQVFRFVSKPWDHNDLVLTLQHAAERYRLARDNAQLIADRERRLRALEILQAVVVAGARGEDTYPARELLDRLREVFSFDLAAVLALVDGQNPILDLTSTRAVNERNVIELRDEAIELFASARGKPVDEARLRPTSSCQVAPVNHAAVVSQAQVTLTLEHEPVGVLVLQSFVADAFPTDATRLLDILANGAAEVLRAIRTTRGSEWRRLTQALAALGDGLVVLGGGGEVQLANEAAHRLLAAAGATVDSLWQVLGSSPSYLLANKGARTREVQFGSRTLQLRTSPIGGGEPGVVLTLRDATAEKDRDARRLRFVSTVSHEIRTPLSAIVATFDLLLHGLVGEIAPRQREYLAGASSACDTLNAVVDDLIDIEKYAAGGMTLVRRRLLLAEVVRAAAVRFCAAAAENGVTICTQPLVKDATVDADNVRLEQVLGNLISNAVKFAPAGSQIDVEVGISDAPEGWAIVGVHNSGPALSVHELETIFDRFATAVAGSSSRHSSGLGLPISRTIVEAHGGVIVVESSSKRTSFWVALPTSTPRPAVVAAELAAPIWVQADGVYDRIGLFATLVRAGLPVRLLPMAEVDAKTARETVGEGLLVTTSDANDRTNVVVLGSHRSDAQAFGETLALLARHAAPRLIVAQEPPSPIGRALQVLGVRVDVGALGDGARVLTVGEPVAVLEALAVEIAGEVSSVGAVRAFLRRSRDGGAEAVLALKPERWPEFITAYDATHASLLRDSLLHEVLRVMGHDGKVSPHVAPAGDGFVCVGTIPVLTSAAADLQLRFDTLVRLHCRKEDRENGYIRLGAQRVAVPTLYARVLTLDVADQEVLAALGIAS